MEREITGTCPKFKGRLDKCVKGVTRLRVVGVRVLGLFDRHLTVTLWISGEDSDGEVRSLDTGRPSSKVEIQRKEDSILII